MSSSRSIQAVLAMINQATDITLDLSNIQLGAPVDISSRPEALGNTEIVIVPTVGSGMVGQATIQYNRVNLKDIVGDLPIVFLWTDELYVKDFLTAVNERFGLAIELDEIDNREDGLPISDEEGKADLVLRADPDSFGWRGEVKITLQRQKLPEVVVVTVLNGLTYEPVIPAQP